ncbi:MAG TPA: c-type cytochrome [Verrucomicrobiae bacterium]|nr:c-type cytochrome [Verrucomicrobiae bacterium]
MLPHPKLWGVAVLFSAAVACSPERYSNASFHLPPDGNVAEGKATFQQLGCHECHRVAGSGLPEPTMQQPVVVVLGGEVTDRPSDAYLVTSMIYPSYALAAYPKKQITTNGKSRMPTYADRMTARQMTDLVAFLQAHYTIPNLNPEYVH